MTRLTSFETRILEAFLSGSETQLAILREQAAAATVSGRTHTGHGAYTDLTVPESLPAVAPSEMVFGDVNAEVHGVENGVAVLLYIENGYLSFLEFATYGGEWPEDPKLTGLGYFREEPMQPTGFSLIPVADRDPEALLSALKGARVQSA